MSERGTVRRYPRGTVVFREGQPSDAVIRLRSGRAKVSYVTSAGREVVLAVHGPGDVLGELGVLDGGARSATVTALDDVEATVIPAGEYQALVASDPELAWRLLRLVIDRLRDADRRIVEHGAYDTGRRVAIRLVELAERFGEEAAGPVTLRFSQDDLAAWAGASREAVNKALRVLRDEGMVATGRGTITVLDVDALARRAAP
jgi:CRP/FNR family cyclic AMP-dependent transcriptional regulator